MGDRVRSSLASSTGLKDAAITARLKQLANQQSLTSLSKYRMKLMIY